MILFTISWSIFLVVIIYTIPTSPFILKEWFFHSFHLFFSTCSAPTFSRCRAASKGLHTLGFTHTWVEIHALQEICRDIAHTHLQSIVGAGVHGRDVVYNFDTSARFLRERLVGACATNLTLYNMLCCELWSKGQRLGQKWDRGRNVEVSSTDKGQEKHFRAPPAKQPPDNLIFSQQVTQSATL